LRENVTFHGALDIGFGGTSFQSWEFIWQDGESSVKQGREAAIVQFISQPLRQIRNGT
jgi:hypothetical protein